MAPWQQDKNGQHWMTGNRETIRHLALFVASAIGGVLVLGPVSDVAAQSGSGGPPRSGWYVGGGVGPNWASGMDQEGWNLETTCYPTEACFDADPVPEVSGYRWRYNIASAAGAVFEISAGRIFDHTRLELSFAQREHGLDQMFRSITDYDGVPMEARRGGSVVSNARNSIDHLTVRTLALNAYYDFPDVVGGIFLYLGAGLGPASSRCQGCTSPPFTRTRLAMLRLTTLPCRFTTAVRTWTRPTRSWPGTCTPGATTA